MNADERVTDNQAESRFELTTGDGLAELIYRRRANRLVLVHTEVPEKLEGHGIGGTLVKAAVDRAVSEGLTVVPLCPFARALAGATIPRSRRPSTSTGASPPKTKPQAHRAQPAPPGPRTQPAPPRPPRAESRTASV